MKKLLFVAFITLAATSTGAMASCGACEHSCPCPMECPTPSCPVALGLLDAPSCCGGPVIAAPCGC